jgi:hypothetical protein
MDKTTRAVFAAYGLGALFIVVLLGFAKGYFVSSYFETRQQEAMRALNQDLIQTKVELEGWKSEISKGSLASAEYRAAFDAHLKEMQDRLDNYAF